MSKKVEISYHHGQAEVDRILQDAGFDLNQPISKTTYVGDSSIRIYEQADSTAQGGTDPVVGPPRIEDVPIKDVPTGEDPQEHPQDSETKLRDGYEDIDNVQEAAQRKESELKAKNESTNKDKEQTREDKKKK